MSSARRALASAFELNLRSLAPAAGIITAVPVVTVFAFGMAIHDPRTAISLAVGANLVAVVSLVGAPRIPLRLALIDALGLGLSVFFGVLTSGHPWLHAGVLVPLCFVAGMAVIYGQTQSVLGTQALVAYIVLGRYGGSPLTALHLGVLVTVGAVVEVAALLVLRLPPTLRYQRGMVATALDNLVLYASTPAEESAFSVLTSIDAAQQVLSPLSLFGRSDNRDLRSIVDQTRRARLDFTTLAGLRSRLALSSPSLLHDVNAALMVAADGFAQVALTVRRPRRVNQWRARASHFQQMLEVLRVRMDADASNVDTITLMSQMIAHLDALGGQLRSIGKLAEREVADIPRGDWRLEVRRDGLSASHLRDNVDLFRDNLHRDSRAFRHAVRLVVAVLVATGIAHWLHLPRGYWIPFAVALILKPDYSTLLRRGIGRVVGTMLGASLAALLVSELHPSFALTTLLVGLVAAAAYTTWAASFSVSIGLITALVLLFLSVGSANSVGTAFDRLIDVTLGALISALTYLIWPSSPAHDVRQTQSALFSSLAHYVDEVLGFVFGGVADAIKVSTSSRAAHMQFANADVAVGRSLEEPAATRGDPQIERGLLSSALRILRTTHALRFEAERGAVTFSTPALETLRRTLVGSLEQLGDESSPSPLPSPTSALRAARADLSLAGESASIALNLDEIVNAINTSSYLIKG